MDTVTKMKQGLQWGILGLLVIGLVGAVSQVGRAQLWWNEAAGRRANLIIHSQQVSRLMNPVWRGVAQGREDEVRLEGLVSEGRQLQLELVRIDHIFNEYNLVSKNGDSLVFDFSLLDSEVQSIVRMGARPMLVLSYMPQAIAEDGRILSKPIDWREWEQVVQRVVEHYSGIDELGISEVYYEVWNEPDLFGNWHFESQSKNYLQLYRHSAMAAQRVQRVWPFYLGGPGTTGMYPNWIRALIRLADEENLPLNFVSWHRYGRQVSLFSEDVAAARAILEEVALPDMQLVISEWGYSSGLDSSHDTNVSAAHAVAVMSTVGWQVDKMLGFELQDGLDPEGRAWWGRWGMINHSRFGTVPKPRYRAVAMMNQLLDNQLVLSGQGTWVRAMASGAKQDLTRSGDSLDTYAMVLTNYDPEQRHTELVSITMIRLEPGNYEWRLERLNGQVESGSFVTERGTWQTALWMGVNEVAVLEVRRVDRN